MLVNTLLWDKTVQILAGALGHQPPSLMRQSAVHWRHYAPAFGGSLCQVLAVYPQWCPI